VEWLRRVEAEYRSAAIASQLAQWLIQLGAPPRLIRLALRIAADELTHAQLSYHVYRRAGGSQAPAIVRETLALERVRPELVHDVLRVGVRVFCLGETAAVRLFHRLRARCAVPSARRALDRVLRDEVRHRDFGWLLLGWLLELPDALALRAHVQASLPALIAELRRNYGGESGDATPPRRLPPSTCAWGLMPLADYQAAITLCISRDLRPRFSRLGIALPDG
jgi:hypothetical protein